MTVAFALSGGGNLGPMQAGAMVALLERGIAPDLLVGTSVGAMNAAYLSTRPGLDGAQRLVEAWLALRRRDVAGFSPVTLLSGFLGIRDHLMPSTRLRMLIHQWMEIERIEDAPTPLAITATDALSGEGVLLRSGDLIDAISASAAIPGLFAPVKMGVRWLVDGSLSSGWPVLEAQALGADQVYLITTDTAPRLRPPGGAVAMAMNSVSLVTARSNQAQLAAARRHAADTGGQVFVVPTGHPNAPGPFDLSKTASLVARAHEQTTAWLNGLLGDPSGAARLGPSDQAEALAVTHGQAPDRTDLETSGPLA